MKHSPFFLLITIFISSIFINCDKRAELSDPLQIAIKMADSQIQRFPQPWLAEFEKKASWGYTQGLVSLSFERLWLETGNKKYFEFEKAYADSLITNDGTIKGYKRDDYNIDNVNSGKILFRLYSETTDQRYLKALKILRDQFKTHPRTDEGGFWHKQRYPHQMWLDGIYMGAPFLAQYGKVFNEKDCIDEAAKQILTIHKHTLDSVTGLNYHGWDESKEQKWSNPSNGQSPNFWGRSMGWYCMGVVDVLDFLPANHPDYKRVQEIFHNSVDAMIKVQDPVSGTWYQVLDKPRGEGNYLEATVSCMMTYAILKGVRMGYLDKTYLNVAKKAYTGILNNFIKVNNDSTISLTHCCAVAGLGGSPYRDGSYKYYVGEKVRENDPKGVGPFIMAAIEMHLAEK